MALVKLDSKIQVKLQIINLLSLLHYQETKFFYKKMLNEEMD